MTEDYAGECNRVSDSLIECFRGEVGGSDRLTLFEGSYGSIAFTFLRSDIFMPLIASYHRKCTKA